MPHWFLCCVFGSACGKDAQQHSRIYLAVMPTCDNLKRDHILLSTMHPVSQRGEGGYKAKFSSSGHMETKEWV